VQRKTRAASEHGQRKDWFKFLGRIQQCNTQWSSGAGNKQVKKIVIATTAPLIPSQTTAISVISGIVTTVGGIVPEQIWPPPMLELLERIASLEKELEAVRARSKVSTGDYVTEGHHVGAIRHL